MPLLSCVVQGCIKNNKSLETLHEYLEEVERDDDMYLMFITLLTLILSHLMHEVQEDLYWVHSLILDTILNMF